MLIVKHKRKGKKDFLSLRKKVILLSIKPPGGNYLSEDKKYLNLTDKFNAGRFKLIGTHDLYFYEKNQIKRVRIVKRADGYFAQFCINIDRKEEHNPTGKAVGIDVGLEYFYTDQ
jgi:putative transposase